MSETFHRRSTLPVPAATAFDWHARPAAFSRIQPPWENTRIADVVGPFGNGQRLTIRTSLLGPVGVDWVAELHDVESGVRFRDRQVSGPFAAWNHTHSFLPDAGGCILEDAIEYALPLGAPGRIAGGPLVRSRLERMFAYRHAVTASDLRRHARFPGRTLTVGITGSNGLVGRNLSLFLAAGGHRVVRFSRRGSKAETHFDGTTDLAWDPEAPVDPKPLEMFDAIVHLAGDGIADGRWSEKKKVRIRESRVGPTRRLAEAAAAAGVKTFLSGSAVGIYGDTGDRTADESSPAGTDFLADVCQEWEAAAEPAGRTGRLVWLRTGIVQSPAGGALAKQLPAFRAGGGAMLGDGTQWVSWIGVGDIVGAIHHALMTDAVRGPVNLVAPEPVTNRIYGRILARILRRPYLLTIPSAALRVLFGEMADAALLASNRVEPKVLKDTGFEFDHPTLEATLRFVLGET